MSNLFHRNPSRNQSSRNGFDLSQRRMFTSPCGMLLPCYYDIAVAGDKYKINSRMFIRTMQLESAAFCRLNGHLDWFFVPFKQIYMFWNEFYNMTNDINTSFLSRAGSSLPLAQFPGYASYNSGFFSSTSDSFVATKTFTLTDLSNPSVHTADYKLAKSDEFGSPYIWNLRRLHDMLYGPITGAPANTGNSYNLMMCLAYHKIFYGHYRNTLYTANDPTMYSADMLATAPSGDTNLYLKLMSTIHYRPWRKDYFTCIQPAPIFGDGFASFMHPVVPSGNSGYDLTDGFPESGSFMNGDTGTTGSSNKTYPESIYGVSVDGSQTSVGDIRAMFAMDKLLRVTASAGSHYDEQTLAHLGFKVPEGIADDPYYIGNQQIQIDINEVVATASTGVTNSNGSAAAGSVIGDIAGKGFGASSNSPDLDFTCPCDGILMGIFSIEPIADYRYESDGNEKYFSTFDFYHPELDNIGMQPFGYPKKNVVLANLASTPLTSYLGWQYRYMQFKTKYDVSHESLWDTDKFSWQASRENLPTTFYNSLQALFYIAPQYTNSIFLGQYPFYGNYQGTGSTITNLNLSKYINWVPGSSAPIDGWWSTANFDSQSVYQYDNFINVVDMKVYKTSIMSVYSLPSM